jgi:hypothetical protein
MRIVRAVYLRTLDVMQHPLLTVTHSVAEKNLTEGHLNSPTCSSKSLSTFCVLLLEIMVAFHRHYIFLQIVGTSATNVFKKLDSPETSTR